MESETAGRLAKYTVSRDNPTYCAAATTPAEAANAAAAEPTEPANAAAIPAAAAKAAAAEPASAAATTVVDNISDAVPSVVSKEEEEEEGEEEEDKEVVEEEEDIRGRGKEDKGLYARFELLLPYLTISIVATSYIPSKGNSQVVA
ncbi:hypothetical protein P8C59_003928 [Phyllachora maydis]|uniref:Uncharacterized protein n=1 Tax=Phyllachora maydis TaxID=1825666 RepID=A0AAD9I2E4_9PEZI|nr:hypothetical protein P8C59_003928 [Phyllachora maydis]